MRSIFFGRPGGLSTITSYSRVLSAVDAVRGASKVASASIRLWHSAIPCTVPIPGAARHPNFITLFKKFSSP